MNKQKILILGLGTTGISAIDNLPQDQYELYAYDDRTELIEKLPEHVHPYDPDATIDLVLKSPGISMENKMVRTFVEQKVPVISDIELAYRLTATKHIFAITGTNGKTTVCLLLHRVLQEAGRKGYIGGNIAIGILEPALKATEDEYLVIECSSFQLETIETFRPEVAIITNISEDHLDHHGGLENYQKSKLRIFENQTDEDVLILNIDDPYLSGIGEENPRAYVTSVRNLEERGAYILDDQLWYNLGYGPTFFMDVKDLQLRGNHHLRNFLEVLVAARWLGVDPESIKETFMNFQGVEHRGEFVVKHEGVTVINDSKGTNIDSTVTAVDSIEEPIHLIAGGYNKGSDFSEMFEQIGHAIKKLYLIGETADIMMEEAEHAGVLSVQKFENLREATHAAMAEARTGETILLSPACASWDQYKNFEERGREFKQIVLEMWGDESEQA